MALINQIGGISTGSIAELANGPLSKLFSNGGIKSFQYPMDLGNDPARMHFVQFSIRDIKPLTVTSQTLSHLGSSAVNSSQNIAGQITSSYKSGGLSSVVSKVETLGKNALGAATSEIGNLFTNTNTIIKPSTTSALAKINLYMPDTLSINYSQEYTDLSLKDALGGLDIASGMIGSLIQDVQHGAKKGDINNIVAQFASQHGATLASMGIDSALGTQLTPLLLKKAGKAFNPQLQLVYQGLGFRTFTMEFLFTPKTAAEAAQVKAIINTFVYASHPTIPQDTAGKYFIPPSIFNISFKMAKSGTFSGLASSLENLGNQVASGTQLGDILGGIVGKNSGLGMNSAVENDRLFKVQDCVLEDVSVDYAPNGWSAYNDGAPIQTRMTLTFKEITINDRIQMENNKVW